MSNTDQFTPEENRREYERLLALLDGGIRDRLMAYPGVIRVDVGLKISGNQLVMKRCFHVTVEQKKSPDKISAAEMIPAEIDGVPTDVEERLPVSKSLGSGLDDECKDSTKHEKICGGIQITNGIEATGSDGSSSYGTLGAIGRDSKRCSNTVGLTNWHVLMSKGGKKGDLVFHPTQYYGDGIDPPQPKSFEDSENRIGKIIIGLLTDKVDVGLIEIDKSCCNCGGVPTSNTINNIALNTYDGISDIANASPGDTVYFVGRTSGRSVGTVTLVNAEQAVEYDQATDAAHPSVPFVHNFVNQIRIMGDGKHKCHANLFADTGDSGSVIVDQYSRVVGLLHSTANYHTSDPPYYSHACHIYNVIDALKAQGIDFEFYYSQPDKKIVVPGSGPLELVTEAPQPFALAETLRERSDVKKILAIIEPHQREVFLLINHCRPVTVAWQRSNGPAFVAMLAGQLRDGDTVKLQPINRFAPVALLRAMKKVLLEHGSESLKRDLNEHADSWIAAAENAPTLDHWLFNLEQLKQSDNN